MSFLVCGGSNKYVFVELIVYENVVLGAWRHLFGEVLFKVCYSQPYAFPTKGHDVDVQKEEVLTALFKFGWVYWHQHFGQIFIEFHHATEVLLSEH